MIDKQIVRQAALSGHCVQIQYQTSEITRRGFLRWRKRNYNVEPYSYRILDGKEFFFAFDIKDKTIKSFNVVSILKTRHKNITSQLRFPLEIT